MNFDGLFLISVSNLLTQLYVYLGKAAAAASNKPEDDDKEDEESIKEVDNEDKKMPAKPMPKKPKTTATPPTMNNGNTFRPMFTCQVMVCQKADKNRVSEYV